MLRYLLVLCLALVIKLQLADTKARITYSLWVDSNITETFSLKMSVPKGASFYTVMQVTYYLAHRITKNQQKRNKANCRASKFQCVCQAAISC